MSHYWKGNLVFCLYFDPRFWSTGDLFFSSFLHFAVEQWINSVEQYGSIFHREFHCDSEFHALKVRFFRRFQFFALCRNLTNRSSILLASTIEKPDLSGFNCFTWNILDQPWNNDQNWPISLFCPEPKFDQNWLQIHHKYKNNLLWYNIRLFNNRISRKQSEAIGNPILSCNFMQL